MVAPKGRTEEEADGPEVTALCVALRSRSDTRLVLWGQALQLYSSYFSL